MRSELCFRQTQRQGACVRPSSNTGRRACRVAATTATAPAGADTLVTVSWRVRHRCRFGERVAIIGGHEHLGAWQPHRSVALSWTEGDDWVGKAMFTPGTKLEYKYIVYLANGTLGYWQPGPNGTLDLEAAGGARFQVTEGWCDTPRQIEVFSPVPTAPAAPQTPLATAAPSALARQHSPERSALALQADKSIDDLQQVLARHAEIQQRVNDPTSLEVLQADRLLAAANNKAVAMNKALRAVDAFPQLPAQR